MDSARSINNDARSINNDARASISDARSTESDIGEACAPPLNINNGNGQGAHPKKWDLEDNNCILAKNSQCCIDFKGYRFNSMETLLCAMMVETLGEPQYIRQIARYTRMDYVKRCATARFELASQELQDKWKCEEFKVWIQILTARIYLDKKFAQTLKDSCGDPLCDPTDLVYSTAITSARKSVHENALDLPLWLGKRTWSTRGQAATDWPTS
jgi:hypothetical protein